MIACCRGIPERCRSDGSQITRKSSRLQEHDPRHGGNISTFRKRMLERKSSGGLLMDFQGRSRGINVRGNDCERCKNVALRWPPNDGEPRSDEKIRRYRGDFHQWREASIWTPQTGAGQP